MRLTPDSETRGSTERRPGRRVAQLLRRMRRVRFATLGIAVVALVVFLALFAGFLAPHDPIKPDLNRSLEPPGLAHLLGTDDLGRDILSRVIYGARISLLAGVVSVAIALVAGVGLGILSGYWGGWVDDAIMRLMDALLSFPAIVLALAIAAAIGAGLTNVMIAIGIVNTPTFARLARGQTLAVRELDFVGAARVLGAWDLRIMRVHLLPNIAAPLIVQTSLSIAFAILAEASLSFLGFGVKPPEPSWGSMVSMGRGYLQQAPWLVFGPGAAIFITVMGFNFVGDALRDALDPRLSRRFARR
jgi:peptide/nickel transport system permease protein